MGSHRRGRRIGGWGTVALGWRAALISFALFLLAHPAAADEAYEVQARASTGFHVAVTINGAAVATVDPAHGGPAAMATPLSPGRLHPGANELRVIYNVVAESREPAEARAFVVTLRRHGNSDGSPLVEVQGPRAPFPHPGAGGSITRRFTLAP